MRRLSQPSQPAAQAAGVVAAATTGAPGALHSRRPQYADASSRPLHLGGLGGCCERLLARTTIAISQPRTKDANRPSKTSNVSR